MNVCCTLGIRLGEGNDPIEMGKNKGEKRQTQPCSSKKAGSASSSAASTLKASSSSASLTNSVFKFEENGVEISDEDEDEDADADADEEFDNRFDLMECRELLLDKKTSKRETALKSLMEFLRSTSTPDSSTSSYLVSMLEDPSNKEGICLILLRMMKKCVFDLYSVPNTHIFTLFCLVPTLIHPKFTFSSHCLSQIIYLHRCSATEGNLILSLLSLCALLVGEEQEKFYSYFHVTMVSLIRGGKKSIKGMGPTALSCLAFNSFVCASSEFNMEVWLLCETLLCSGLDVLVSDAEELLHVGGEGLEDKDDSDDSSGWGRCLFDYIYSLDDIPSQTLIFPDMIFRPKHLYSLDDIPSQTLYSLI